MSATAKTEEIATRPEGYPEQVPAFATEQEEREFWDTHDSTYYLDDTEDVTNNPPPELGRGPGRAGSHARKRPGRERMDLVQLLLRDDAIAAIKDIAARRHTSPQALMSAWITTQLEHEKRI